MPSFTASNSLDLVGSQVITGGLTIGTVSQGSEVTSGLKITTGDLTVDTGGLTVAGGLTVSGGAATVPCLSVTGLNTDVDSGTRLVGAVASSAPIGGTYLTGDFVIGRNGSLWICTLGGAPGTWTQVSGGGGGGGNGTTTYSLTIGSGLSGSAGSTFNGSAANAVSLNLSSANIWTATQTFSNATSAIFGSGDGTGTITGGLLRAPSSTGTNIAGGSLTIAGGAGTGTGAGGSIIFQTAPAGTTGSTANTLATRMRIADNGAVLVGSIASSTTHYASFATQGKTNLEIAGTGTFAGSGEDLGFPVLSFSTNALGPGSALTSGEAGGLFWGLRGTAAADKRLGVLWMAIEANSTATPYGSMYFSTAGASGLSERMRINSSGNVGIGTSSPGAILDIQGSTESLYMLRANGANSNAPNLRIRKARGTVASKTVITNGDFLGHITFEGHDGTNFLEGAGIYGISNGAVSSNTMSSDLMFLTRSGTTLAERMRISSSGNVGIGTGTPSAPLSITPTTYSATAGVINKIGLWDSTPGVPAYGFGISAGSLDLITEGAFNFWGTGSTKRATVNNVGVQAPRFVRGFPNTLTANSLLPSTHYIGTGMPTSIGDVGTGSYPAGITVDPTGRFVYSTDSGSSSVQTYAINQYTGAMTSVGPVVTGSAPMDVACDPSGRFAYVTNSGGDTVQAYTINQSTGLLTSVGAVAVASNPRGIAVDPSGKFVYATSLNGSVVQAYTINQSTGALTSIGTTATGFSPWGIACDPTGRFVFVANYSGSANTVQAYTINQSTGALTSVGAVAAGTNPIHLACDPTGRFLFTSNISSNTVQAYTINQSTGALTSVGAIATGTGPMGVSCDHTGRFVYVACQNANTVQIYTINQSTGVLTSAGTVATGTNPNRVAASPTGQFLYITNYGSNTVRAFAINNFSAGGGTFTGTINIGTLGVAIDASKNFYPGGQTTNYWGWDGSGITKYGSGYTYIGTGYFIVQDTLRPRNGIYNDTGAYLTISGGTSGHTYFAGPVGVRVSSPQYGMHLIGSDSGANGGLMIERVANDTSTNNSYTRGLYIRSGDRAVDFGITGSAYSDANYANKAWATTGGRFGWGAGGSAPTQMVLETTGTLHLNVGASINNSLGLTFVTHASETAARANYTDMLYGLFTGSDVFRLQVGNRSTGWNGTSSTAMAADNGYVELATADAANEPIYVSQYSYVTPYTTGTASQSGNTITGSGTTWTSAMVGAEFYFTGAVPKVRAGVIKIFNSATSIVVDTNQTVASTTYTIGGFMGSLTRRAALLDENGYTSFPSRLGIGTSTPTGTLDIASAQDASYVNVLTALAPSLSAGNATYMATGKANSSNNAVSFNFYYAGSGSTNNRGDFTFWGGSPIVSMLPSGNFGIGTTAPGAKLDVAGALRLSGSTSGYVGFAPAAAAGSTTYTLPSADGTSGQVLRTNGSGVLSWGTGLDLAAANTWSALQTFAGGATVTGDLTVTGNFTTVNSVVTTIENPTLDIGGGLGGAAPTLDDGYDRGITFQWHNGTAAEQGFFGFDRSTQYWTYIPDATITNGLVSGTPGSLASGGVVLTDAASTPSAPGAGLTSLYSKSGEMYYRSGASGAETSVATTGKAIAMAIVFG